MSNAEESCIALSEKIQNKESKVGLNGLNDSEKQFYLVDNLLMQLNNGGFDQYFTNSTGQYWNDTVSVLERLDLQLLVELGKKAKAIFDSDEDEDDKLDQLSELDNVFYDELDYDEVYEKLLSLF